MNVTGFTKSSMVLELLPFVRNTLKALSYAQFAMKKQMRMRNASSLCCDARHVGPQIANQPYAKFADYLVAIYVSNSSNELIFFFFIKRSFPLNDSNPLPAFAMPSRYFKCRGASETLGPSWHLFYYDVL
ncbi:hypothetical protein AMTRI_Chr12g273100 [Amborella trichopoda]